MIENTYPPECIPVEAAVNKIREVFSHHTLMVERFSIETITPNGDTLKFKWDRKNVGQPYSIEENPDDLRQTS